MDSKIDAIADTEECRSARPGDILLSVPARPTKEVPVDVTENRSVPDMKKNRSRSYSLQQMVILK